MSQELQQLFRKLRYEISDGISCGNIETEVGERALGFIFDIEVQLTREKSQGENSMDHLTACLAGMRKELHEMNRTLAKRK